MQWNSLSEFFAMGGYALYVWGSFGITALVVVLEIWEVRARHRAVLQSLSNETGTPCDPSEA